MAKADVYIVDDADNIPDEAMTEVANYLAIRISPGCSALPARSSPDIQQRAALAEQALRYQRVMGPTYQIQQADYF